MHKYRNLIVHVKVGLKASACSVNSHCCEFQRSEIRVVLLEMTISETCKEGYGLERNHRKVANDEYDDDD
jgi:hypothetical protein